ncbi:AbrB family transcriptional regulator [Paenibacillus thalictri]|uniref:AbrB family transcriptional regulator n=1 Tax=Paenibacillus thalictri TaxID=2527873 RepID=A0A4Q9DYU6_9BACL|nr:AbrB family transcriptional regulator [Paenibacillus thalictri]TBL81083.1 AbrB family transcriptional regulator [Paenibacillus thalictri]
MDEPARKRYVSMGISLITAIVGGIVFKLLHLPIPWLLGPMVFVLIGSNVFKGSYQWSGQIRNGAMIVVGYTIGLSMTAAALKEMSYQLPAMLLMNVLLLLVCSAIAFIVSKLSDTDFNTALLGSMPGGLTQMVLLAEESEGVDLTVVTVTQVIRLIIIIVCIPMLVFSPIFGQTHSAVPAAQALTGSAAGWSGSVTNLLVFAVVCVICAVGGTKIKFPTAFLLGPIIGTAALQLCGLQGPTLPTFVINAVQLAIGVNVGLMLKPGKLARKGRIISLAVASGLALMLGAWGLSELLTLLHPVSRATSLLSLAPGGADQMGIIAHEIHADLSMVAGYQLFRAFFILFAVPPLIRMLFRLQHKRKSGAEALKQN